MKNIILPSLVVLAVVGLIIFFGSSSQKPKSSSPASSTPSTTSSVSYFDENAKVMFFYSDLCSWCQKEKTILEKLATEGYRVKPMDVRANPSIWTEYKIEGTPTFIAPDGQRLVGYADEVKLKEFLDKYK